MNFQKFIPSKQTIYFLSLFGTIFCVFMFFIFVSSNKDTTTTESKVSETKDGSLLSQILGISKQKTPTKQAFQQDLPPEVPDIFGPTKPLVTPAPIPTIAPTIPPIASTPNPTPTSTPAPQPPAQNNPTPTPTSTPTPSPTPTPFPTSTPTASPIPTTTP